MEDLVYPLYYRVAYRERNNWHFKQLSVFYNPSNISIVDPNDIKALYDMTWGQLAVAFFRINGGKEGWYLANLKDRQYYYCGEERESVRAKLQSLGIGQPDPISD